MVRAWGLGLALGLAGCADAPQGRALGLLDFRQAGLDSVALNEELLFYFSDDLDRASICSDSVHIVDEQGQEVPGDRSVRGNALSFRPKLPCASDLSDGGLRPGDLYRVVLGGFPRPDGIRSQSGALLSATLLFSFRTAVPGPNPLFLRPVSVRFPLLTPLGKRVVNGWELEEGFIELECNEALDPSSVPGARFQLKYSPPGTRQLEEVPLAVRLSENQRERARLLLRRADGEPLVPGEYFLSYMPECDLRTLGGRGVELRSPGQGRKPLTLIVAPARAEVVLDAARLKTGEVPPGCDGTAVWNETGAGVRLRFPAAAGDGRDGAVELRGTPSSRDVQATRLALREGETLDLSPISGPVVLRSQTALEIQGRLTRQGAVAGLDEITLDLENDGELPPEQRRTLSAWIEQLLDPGQPEIPYTVLIAGGDIRIARSAVLDIEGPLVLVAGGAIRVEANNVVVRGDVWRPEDGPPASHRRRRILPLQLDEPAVNPLRTRLVVGTLTQPFPWTSGLILFIRPAHQDGHRWTVEFQPVAEEVGVEPGSTPAGQARALIRMEMGPGPGQPWDPPHIERLVLEGVAGKR